MKYAVTFQVLKIAVVLLFAAAVTISCTTDQPQTEQTEDVPVIPYPEKVLKRSGYINLNHNFWVITNVSDTSMARLGKYLVDQIEQIPGALGSIADLFSTRNHEQAITIERVDDHGLGPQGYRMTITSRNIQIQATNETGIYYGIQTILTLLKSHWDEESRTAKLRSMVIIDNPKSLNRIIDLSEINDSIDIAGVVENLSLLKINGILLPQHYDLSPDLLEENYITLYEQREILNRSRVRLTSNKKQLRGIFNNQEFSETDTIIYHLQFSEAGILPLEIFVAAQRSWSGFGKKDFDWLMTRAEEKLITKAK